MTARYFLGERRESQLCACLPFLRHVFLFFGVTLFLVIILDQKSPCGSSVASAASWASLRGGELCWTLTQDTFVSRDELALCHFEAQVYDVSLPASISAALFRGELCCILTQDTFLSRDEFVFLGCRKRPEEWTRSKNGMSGGDSYGQAAACLFWCFSAQSCFHLCFCASSARHRDGPAEDLRAIHDTTKLLNDAALELFVCIIVALVAVVSCVRKTHIGCILVFF